MMKNCDSVKWNSCIFWGKKLNMYVVIDSYFYSFWRVLRISLNLITNSPFNIRRIALQPFLKALILFYSHNTSYINSMNVTVIAEYNMSIIESWVRRTTLVQHDTLYVYVNIIDFDFRWYIKCSKLLLFQKVWIIFKIVFGLNIKNVFKWNKARLKLVQRFLGYPSVFDFLRIILQPSCKALNLFFSHYALILKMWLLSLNKTWASWKFRSGKPLLVVHHTLYALVLLTLNYNLSWGTHIWFRQGCATYSNLESHTHFFFRKKVPI